MAVDSNISSIHDYWDFVFVDLADPRTKNWFLMESPIPPLAILVAYLYIVLKSGPEFMRDRKPYDLKTTLIVYNFIQVLMSTYIFLEGLVDWLTYNWKCQPVDFSYSPTALRTANICHIYFLAKMTELLDTIFFVLRKKNSQITFLHVYHHTVMPMISWGCTKYYPGGHGIFIGLINSFIHIIMYIYYLLAAFGPRFQKILWWKKYITNLQMVQFCITFLYNSQLLFYDCGYPRWTVFFTLPNSIFFFYLFNDFYKKAYTPEEKEVLSNNKEDAVHGYKRNESEKID